MPDPIRLPVAAPPLALELPSGRTVEVEDDAGAGRVVVRGSSGRVEVAIRFTDEGPVLEMSAVALTLRAQETVSVECERFEVRSEEIEFQTEGDLVTCAGGVALTQGANVAMVANAGDVEVVASRDTIVRGERVLVNC